MGNLFTPLLVRRCIRDSSFLHRPYWNWHCATAHPWWLRHMGVDRFHPYCHWKFQRRQGQFNQASLIPQPLYSAFIPEHIGRHNQALSNGANNMGACPVSLRSTAHPAVRCYSSCGRCSAALRDIRSHRWRTELL